MNKSIHQVDVQRPVGFIWAVDGQTWLVLRFLFLRLRSCCLVFVLPAACCSFRTMKVTSAFLTPPLLLLQADGALGVSDRRAGELQVQDQVHVAHRGAVSTAGNRRAPDQELSDAVW